MADDPEKYFQPRPVQETEYIATFADLVARLDRHIVNVGNQQKGARDDLAAVLRILINRDGGNDAIGRFCKLTKRPEPQICVSTLNLNSKHLVLQIAGLPEVDNLQLNTTVPTGLRTTTCVAKMEQGKVRTFTWETLIDAYGNTFGSHLGQKIPKLLDEVRLHGFGDTDFGSYMLRSIGVAISAACHVLLLQVNTSHKPVTHDPLFQGMEVTAVNFTFDGRQHSLEAKARRQNWKAAGPLVSVVAQDGMQFILGTAEGGFLRLTTVPPKKKA